MEKSSDDCMLSHFKNKKEVIFTNSMVREKLKEQFVIRPLNYNRSCGSEAFLMHADKTENFKNVFEYLAGYLINHIEELSSKSSPVVLCNDEIS